MDVDGIKKEDTLDIQARITLLNLAPSIVTNAIKAGWISYPANAYVDPEEQWFDPRRLLCKPLLDRY